MLFNICAPSSSAPPGTTGGRKIRSSNPRRRILIWTRRMRISDGRPRLPVLPGDCSAPQFDPRAAKTRKPTALNDAGSYPAVQLRWTISFRKGGRKWMGNRHTRRSCIWAEWPDLVLLTSTPRKAVAVQDNYTGNDNSERHPHQTDPNRY